MRTSRIYSSACAAALVLPCLGGGAVAGELERAAPALKRIVKGRYEVSSGGRVIGEEEFTEQVFGDNTMVLECRFEVLQGPSPGTVLAGKTRLEIDEDSRFPRKYDARTVWKAGAEEEVVEVESEMFANVVVFERRAPNSTSQRTLVIPTGTPFVQQNVAHQLAILLHRYDGAIGGRQAFEAFEPSAGKLLSVAVEYVGEDAGGGGAREAAWLHYRFFFGNSPPNDLYADRDGRIVRRVLTFQGVEYTLISLEVREDPGGPE